MELPDPPKHKPENPGPALTRLTKYFQELEDMKLFADWVTVTESMAWAVKNAGEHAERLKKHGLL